jgi:hypothetical protein
MSTAAGLGQPLATRTIKRHGEEHADAAVVLPWLNPGPASSVAAAVAAAGASDSGCDGLHLSSSASALHAHGGHAVPSSSSSSSSSAAALSGSLAGVRALQREVDALKFHQRHLLDAFIQWQQQQAATTTTMNGITAGGDASSAAAATATAPLSDLRARVAALQHCFVSVYSNLRSATNRPLFDISNNRGTGSSSGSGGAGGASNSGSSASCSLLAANREYLSKQNSPLAVVAPWPSAAASPSHSHTVDGEAAAASAAGRASATADAHSTSAAAAAGTAIPAAEESMSDTTPFAAHSTAPPKPAAAAIPVDPAAALSSAVASSASTFHQHAALLLNLMQCSGLNPFTELQQRLKQTCVLAPTAGAASSSSSLSAAPAAATSVPSSPLDHPGVQLLDETLLSFLREQHARNAWLSRAVVDEKREGELRQLRLLKEAQYNALLARREQQLAHLRAQRDAKIHAHHQKAQPELQMRKQAWRAELAAAQKAPQQVIKDDKMRESKQRQLKYEVHEYRRLGDVTKANQAALELERMEWFAKPPPRAPFDSKLGPLFRPEPVVQALDLPLPQLPPIEPLVVDLPPSLYPSLPFVRKIFATDAIASPYAPRTALAVTQADTAAPALTPTLPLQGLIFSLPHVLHAFLEFEAEEEEEDDDEDSGHDGMAAHTDQRTAALAAAASAARGLRVSRVCVVEWNELSVLVDAHTQSAFGLFRELSAQAQMQLHALRHRESEARRREQQQQQQRAAASAAAAASAGGKPIPPSPPADPRPLNVRVLHVFLSWLSHYWDLHIRPCNECKCFLSLEAPAAAAMALSDAAVTVAEDAADVPVGGAPVLTGALAPLMPVVRIVQQQQQTVKKTSATAASQPSPPPQPVALHKHCVEPFLRSQRL